MPFEVLALILAGAAAALAQRALNNSRKNDKRELAPVRDQPRGAPEAALQRA